MCYTLPKIWLGRISKYWDKTVPTGFPVSSSKFNTWFVDDEVRTAVETFEAQLGTEESVVAAMLPDDTFVSNYVGVYDVDGVAGELTLLFPEKVSNTPLLVLHYNAETATWEQITDYQIIDGYVWGTLESFSPVAVVEYKKDIHVVTLDYLKYPAVVCEGNTVQLKYNDNNKPVVINTATGTEIEINEVSVVVGGSADGRPIESTCINVIDVPAAGNVNVIYAGSVFYDAENPKNFTTIQSQKVVAVNSTVRAITGSAGQVRVQNHKVTVENCKVLSHVAAGESYISKLKKDVNGENPTLGSPAWVMNSDITIKNSTAYILYGAGNTGYMYVQNAKLVVDGLKKDAKSDYFCPAGSNGHTENAVCEIRNSELRHISCTNRGSVKSVDLTVVDSTVDNFYIGGDNSEGDVDGTIDSVKVNVNAGSGVYNFKLGVDGKENITADKVESVKVSRNAGVFTIEDSLLSVLGSKYIIK